MIFVDKLQVSEFLEGSTSEMQALYRTLVSKVEEDPYVCSISLI